MKRHIVYRGKKYKLISTHRTKKEADMGAVRLRREKRCGALVRKLKHSNPIQKVPQLGELSLLNPWGLYAGERY